jgi:hypothetical protein
VFALSQRLWLSAFWIFVILLLYLAFVRVTLCRVETLQHRPCRWRVRGFIRTCEFHIGLKRSLPTLVRSPTAGFVLPMLMWPRPDLAVTFDRVEPQPSPSATDSAAFAPRDRQLAGHTPEAWIGFFALLVAVAQLVVAIVKG